MKDLLEELVPGKRQRDPRGSLTARRALESTIDAMHPSIPAQAPGRTTLTPGGVSPTPLYAQEHRVGLAEVARLRREILPRLDEVIADQRPAAEALVLDARLALRRIDDALAHTAEIATAGMPDWVHDQRAQLIEARDQLRPRVLAMLETAEAGAGSSGAEAAGSDRATVAA